MPQKYMLVLTARTCRNIPVVQTATLDTQILTTATRINKVIK